MRLHFILLLAYLAAGLFGQSAWAQVVAPSQGGEVGIVFTTATSMELSFGTTGTGQGRVVAMAEAPGGMPVQLTAVDGQFYTAASRYGLGSPIGVGYVVYNGTGHSVVVSGLTPNTFYYVTNAEYNTNAGAIAYNTNGISMSTATRSGVAPLPVELTAFTGTVDAHNLATLHWATASERNAAYFALERSADGVSFSEIGRVAASGTTARSSSYQWSDPQQLTSLVYYRLRQVDTDGKTQYSGVVSLKPLAATSKSVQVYPNPSAGHEVQLLLQGYDGESLELRLTDALGRLVYTQNLFLTGDQYATTLAATQSLPAGSYILTLGSRDNAVRKRIVISK